MIRSNCLRALVNGQNWPSGHSSHFENETGFFGWTVFFLSTCNPFTAICLLLFMTELVLASHFWLTVSALNLLSSNTEPHHFNTTQI